MAKDEVRGDPPLVIKVGGSLAKAGRLDEVLAKIGAARIPIVVVPGGGPFADAVRDLQKVLQFDDEIAHRLALLAMEQMAEYIASRQSGMKVARSLDEISDAVIDGQIPVWAPLQMIGEDQSVCASWDVTSDALSAQLAELMGARLLILKSASDCRNVDADELAAKGIVDNAFPEIVSRAGLSWSIFGPEDDADLLAVLAGEGSA